jgi:DNA-binding PadR family transcriptional regulator
MFASGTKIPDGTRGLNLPSALPLPSRQTAACRVNAILASMPRRHAAALRLDHALLGLLHEKPRSGYDLRKLFATSPMGQFSDSPGSIYPALRRLAREGLIAGTTEGAALRPRQVFQLTSSGIDALRRWLSVPVTRDELVHGEGAVMLRFAFVDQVLGTARAFEFVAQLAAVLVAYVTELEQFHRQQGSAMPLVPRLALESGIALYRAHRDWAQRTARQLEAEVSKRG